MGGYGGFVDPTDGVLYGHWYVPRWIPTLGGERATLPPILQEMFLHATHSRRREAEWMICWGHQHGLLCLDPQGDVSTIQSIGPHTSREEVRDLYYKVYKLRRLSGPLPCGPEQAGELMRDMVSYLKNHLRQKEDESQRGQGGSEFADTHPMQNRTPWGKTRHFSWNWAC